MQPNEALELKKRHLAPCVNHFYKRPPVIHSGHGVWLVDQDDRKYLDLFSGVSVNHLGHAHPKIVKAISSQAAKLGNLTTIYLTEPALLLAQELANVSPIPDTKVFFCASGSEANETALFLARNHTRKPTVLGLSLSLHGSTFATLSLTGLPFWKGYLDSEDHRVAHAPSPECFRCPVGKNKQTCKAQCVETIDKLLQERSDIGTICLEVLPGNGGILEAPAVFFDQLKAVIIKRQLTLIVDEVQTGFGRTGEMFACQQYGLEPDFITIAKSIGGGLPMGAVLSKSSYYDNFPFPRASTFGANCIVSAAALAFLKELKEADLVNQSKILGAKLKAALGEIQSGWIADVRGLGLMVGVELCYPHENNKNPAPAMADFVLEEMKDLGFLLGRGGAERNVLIWQPPLIITWEQLETAVRALKFVIQRWEAEKANAN